MRHQCLKLAQRHHVAAVRNVREAAATLLEALYAVVGEQVYAALAPCPQQAGQQPGLFDGQEGMRACNTDSKGGRDNGSIVGEEDGRQRPGRAMVARVSLLFDVDQLLDRSQCSQR